MLFQDIRRMWRNFKIGSEMRACDVKKRGFTIVELLVVITVISAIMSITLPALNSARRHAKAIINVSNQKQIVTALNLFANDNDDNYPDSVATVGTDRSWNWSDPTRLIGTTSRSPRVYRAMSEYLGSYIDNAETMFCPCAPRKYKYLQEAWEAGDKWDNPDTGLRTDSLGGTYCFYWNYIGYLGGTRRVFYGPGGQGSDRNRSKLLVSDYFGYNNWRNPGYFGSCEPFSNAEVTPETWLLSAYWSGKRAEDDVPRIKLHAGYTDGHVESYLSDEVVPMKVSLTSNGRTPYPDGVGPGTFFLPEDAIR